MASLVETHESIPWRRRRFEQDVSRASSMTRLACHAALCTAPCGNHTAEVIGTFCLSMRLLHGHQPQAILHQLVKNSKLVLPGAATAVAGITPPTSLVKVAGVTDGAVGLAIVPDCVPVLPEAFCVRSVSSLRVGCLPWYLVSSVKVCLCGN